MKNKKLTLLVVLSVILVALIGIAVVLFASGGGQGTLTEPSGVQENETVGNSAVETEDLSQETEATAEAIVETAPPATETQPTEPEETTVTPSGAGKPQNNQQGNTSGGKKPTALEFPYAIPGADLVIQKIDSYDGIFLEDGSDRNVSGVCAMVLVNQGSIGVEYANINLSQNGANLVFKATVVPAGATVVVQESNGAAYSTADVTDCTADVAVVDAFEMSASLVEVKENDDGSLQVTNLTGETIPCVRLFYKFVLEKDVYVGGITYTAKITELTPEASQQVIPSHYAAGSSEIVMVRTYDSAE